METEFFGKLSMKIINNEQSFKPECIDWTVLNPDETVNNRREIEDGDILQVYDGNGKLVLNKYIYRDNDSLYNPRYRKQIYNGMAVKWIPEGIDTGYWYNLFRNHHRARLVKTTEE